MKLNAHTVMVAMGFSLLAATTASSQGWQNAAPATTPAPAPAARRAPGAAQPTTAIPEPGFQTRATATVAEPVSDPLDEQGVPSPPPGRKPTTVLMDAYAASLRPNAAGRAERPLLVRSTEADAKTLGSMEEDLNIMGRILEKAAPQSTEDTPEEAMGVKLVMLSGAGGAQTMQIEGYGAIFQLRVNIPLRGTVEQPEDAISKPPADSPWEQTKRELRWHSNPGATSAYTTRQAVKVRANPYNPKLVERLKDALLMALKNAANMSHLKPDETVTVVVRSSGQPVAILTDNSVVLENIGGNFVRYSKPATADQAAQIVPGEKTDGAILTIRAKKSDIDDFAKDKLNLDQFRKQASILLY